jgi:hypothetical protein
VVTKVRPRLDAVVHAAERIAHDLRERPRIRPVGPEFGPRDCKRREHGEFDRTPKPNLHRQARPGAATNGEER